MCKYYLLELADGSYSAGISYDGTIPEGATECTQEQYQNAASFTVKNGSVIACTPPAMPLKVQAETALTKARSFVYNNYGILNEATPTDLVAYLKALMAIADGSDVTTTALPAAPGEIT